MADKTKKFQQIFSRLKNIMEKYEDGLELTQDTPAEYSLNGHFSEKWEKQLFFGKTNIGKNYVSYHLMPVYMYPELLEEVSDDLKKRMQGKSCFNFSRIDEELFRELEELTDRSYQRFKKQD